MKYSIFLALILLILAEKISCGEVCYGLHGCYIDTPPFGGTPQRFFALLPQSPSKINTKYVLYNKNYPQGQSINFFNSNSYLIASLPVKFIIHGFLSSPKGNWCVNMKNAILEYDNVNLITVDWSDANGYPYTQSIK